MDRLSRPRFIFLWACGRGCLVWGDGTPKAADYFLQTRSDWRKLGAVVKIDVIRPIAFGRIVNIGLTPHVRGIAAREHLHHRSIAGKRIGETPGFQEARKI